MTLATIILVMITLLALFWVLPVTGKTRKKKYITPSDEPGPYVFPAGFLWGTATAAQQIESAQKTDWTAFEKKVYKEKKFSSRGPGEAEPGHIHEWGSYKAAVRRDKTGFDKLYTKDLKAAASLDNNTFRFSICWARLFPTEKTEKPDPAGLAYYRKILNACDKNGLIPSVTLFHFSSPEWFFKEKDGKRGWERDDALEHFERFVRAVVKAFGKRVEHWCTLNEPMVYVFNGYLEGIFPPNEKRSSPAEVVDVVKTLLKAHALAYRIIHENAEKNNLKAEVGLTKHTRAFEPYRNTHLLDRVTAAIVEKNFIYDFIDAINTGVFRFSATKITEEIPEIKGTWDYIGINYYGRFYIQSNLLKPADFKLHMHDEKSSTERVNDLNWALYPHGFYEVLTEFDRRYGKPVYILENGTADKEDDDLTRQHFLVTHLREVYLAVKAGVDIRGYYHWALFDNFEWAEGFTARFGLYSVDYKNNFERRPRLSAALYREIAGANAISEEIWQNHS